MTKSDNSQAISRWSRLRSIIQRYSVGIANYANRVLKYASDTLGLIVSRVHNKKVRQNILQAVPFWFASLLSGIIAVGYARLFAYTEGLSLELFHEHRTWFYIFSPTCFVVAWFSVRYFAPYAKGSGIPQVMAAVELAGPSSSPLVASLVSFRVIVVKIASSIAMVLGGGAVGREGPTIQVAGSVFSVVNSLLPDWWPKISKKNMIMTGAAAGLAAAFNTPLGGIVFAVEELTKMHISYFKAAIFTAVILAGLTAQSMLGSYLYLGYPEVVTLSSYALVWVVLVATTAGLGGSVMSKIIYKILVWKETFSGVRSHLFYLTVSAVAIVSMAVFVDESALGSGKSLISTTLFSDAKYVAWYAPIVRICSPILSFTGGAAGGVFAPGLSAGASIGSLVSSWLTLNESETNLMILSGMVAFLTGITRAPFTSAILVLEMTDRNNLILHLMVAGLVASTVSLVVDKHSLYHHLKLRYVAELRSDRTDHIIT